jgi:hypothetical protein
MVGDIISTGDYSKNETCHWNRTKTKTANKESLLLQVWIRTSSDEEVFIKEKEKSGN